MLNTLLHHGAPAGRIQFIDALRAFAILMMLQGHFIDALLDPVYRDKANFVYSNWAFMRGMTAPIFFTVTGLIFVFLLSKDRGPLHKNQRVKKGIRRAVLLIGIGYLLRLNVSGLFKGEIYPSFWAADVLHIIGFSLLALTALYVLHRTTRLPFSVLLATGGLLIFYNSLNWKAADWSFLPRFLENYFTQEHGSVFILYPWVGYAMFGGMLGRHIHRNREWYATWWWPAVILATGSIIHFSSSKGLMNLHELTGLQSFRDHAYNNYILYRMGHVLIVVALFIYLEQVLKRFPALFLKIGTETLTIYAVHFVVLYGSWFGIGLVRYWRGSLDPHTAAIGALLFVSSFALLIARIERVRRLPQQISQAINQGWQSEITATVRYQLRRAAVLGRRRILRWKQEIRSREIAGRAQRIYNADNPAK